MPAPSHPIPWDVSHGIPIRMTFPWTSLFIDDPWEGAPSRLRTTAVEKRYFNRKLILLRSISPECYVIKTSKNGHVSELMKKNHHLPYESTLLQEFRAVAQASMACKLIVARQLLQLAHRVFVLSEWTRRCNSCTM